jgi:hypothetical protein
MTRTLTALALALALVPQAAFAQKLKADLSRNGWHTDYASGLREAKRTGKPILLVFRCDP